MYMSLREICDDQEAWLTRAATDEMEGVLDVGSRLFGGVQEALCVNVSDQASLGRIRRQHGNSSARDLMHASASSPETAAA